MGVGASAGGLEAFTRLLENLPADTGMAFVLVQHLDPDHKSALPGILARATAMPVRQITDKMVVQPNHVYVIPPDKRLTLAGEQLRLDPREQRPGTPHSIDAFFESLAQQRQERAIGVILSGTASDGTLGLEAIKAEGGVTFAQDASAQYDSMPRNAIAAGCVDFVLSTEGIARELGRIAKHPHVAGGGLRPPGDSGHDAGLSGAPSQGGTHTETGRWVEDRTLRKILLLLRNHRRVDFSLYKASTMQRRIARRMVLGKCETLEAYAAFLRGNEKELEGLYSDMLISVTSFFRNPEAFDALKSEVFAKLLQHRRPDEPIRVWVTGCSTGQEAYSIAMAYQEFCENRARPPALQLFATDLNETLLDKARQGFYPRVLVGDVSPERLRRFFVEEEGGYRVRKALRERCVFARHNLLSDPPFSRLDLISCRNVLIYIEATSQKKILPTLHYALKPNAFLFLGASESVGLSDELFEPADKKLRIFSRKPGLTPRLLLAASGGPPSAMISSAPGGKAIEGKPGELNALREADRVIANRFAPPGVLIDSNLRIVQSRGAIEDYLALAAGKASLDVLKMARSDLMLPLRAAINKARKHGKAVRMEDVSRSYEAEKHGVSLEVIPLRNLKERHYLVFFEETPRQTAGRASPSSDKLAATRPGGGHDKGSLVAGLERELTGTREYLQSVQEQYEAANEELQASNEEVTSANEELQSMNEELETSKEELESSNEELTTVNEEMAHRNRELSHLNSDLNNLQASINTPVLVVGRDLRIRRFTPLAEKVFNLMTGDAGRPLSSIRHNLDFPGLEEFITETIATLRTQEREVRDTSGNWYVLRVRPYLTVDSQIDGAVVVLVDVNVLKETERKIREARNLAEAVIESVPPLLTLESDLRVRKGNAAFYRTFGVTAKETEGRSIYELGNGQWDIAALRKLLGEVLPQNKVFSQYEVTHDFESIGRRTMLMSARQVESMSEIVLSIEDITERKRGEEALRQSEERLAQAVQVAGVGTFDHDHRADVIEFSPMARSFLGFAGDEPVTMATMLERVAAEDRESLAAAIRRANEPSGDGMFEAEHRIASPDGRIRWMSVRARTFFEGEGGKRRPVRTLGAVLDVTERREFQEGLERLVRERTTKLQELVGDLEHFSYTITHDMRAPLRAMKGYAEMANDLSANDEKRETRDFLSRIITAADRMDLLIRDALNYSQAVRQELVLGPVDTGALLRGMLDSYPGLQASRARIEIQGPLPLVLANEAGLTQCFSNLLGNAVKFAKPGEMPRVAIRAEQRDGWVRIWFEDNGIGIPKEMRARVFDMFSRGHQSYEGTGIGLALVRKVISRMDGKVGVESEDGQGSRFWLDLRPGDGKGGGKR